MKGAEPGSRGRPCAHSFSAPADQSKHLASITVADSIFWPLGNGENSQKNCTARAPHASSQPHSPTPHPGPSPSAPVTAKSCELEITVRFGVCLSMRGRALG